MHWILSYILTYIIGGLTFVPLVVLMVLYFIPRVPSDSTALSQLDKFEREKEAIAKGEDPEYRSLKAGELMDKATIGVNTFQSGWITVTKEFYTFAQINPLEFSQSSGSTSLPTNNASGTSKSNNGGSHESTDNDSSAPPSTFSGGASGNTTIASSIVKIMKGGSTASDPSTAEDPASLDAKKLRNIRRKNRYFAVLKHGNLFLYNNEEMTNVQHVIVMANHIVSIWPRNLRDGRLFSKKTAICLLKKDDPNVLLSHNSQAPMSTLDLLISKEEFQNETAPKNAFYLYGDLNHQKEDWYFALIRATTTDALKTNSPLDLMEPSFYARSLHYNTADMIDLIQTLNSTEGQLTTKWLNAIIGRLFLSLHKTESFHQFIKNRVEIQLQKIKKPGFLDDFVIKKIDVGHSAPFISNPTLKTLSPEGDLEAVVNFLYQGGLTVEISTKVFLNLGVRFKPREFSINLKVKLKRIHGDLLIKMKPAPSNRLWYGFTKMPKLDLVIEPVVSTMSFNYNLVTNIISNKFKEAIRDTLVLPFMDDFVFAKTDGEIFRGGIWDKSFRPMQMDAAYAAMNANRTVPIPSPVAQTTEPSTDSGDPAVIPTPTTPDSRFDNQNPPPVPSRSRTSSNATSMSDYPEPQAVSAPSTVSNFASLREENEIAESAEPLESLDEQGDESSIVSKGSSSAVSRLKSQKASLTKRASHVLDLVDKKLSSSTSDLTRTSDSEEQQDTESGEAVPSSGINSVKNNKYVSTSMTKLKGWYSKEKQSLQKIAETRAASNGSTDKKSYVAPEMISSRRVRKQSNTSVDISMNSRDGGSSINGLNDSGIFGEQNNFPREAHKQTLEAIPPNDAEYSIIHDTDRLVASPSKSTTSRSTSDSRQNHHRTISYDSGAPEMRLPMGHFESNGPPPLPDRSSLAMALDTESSMFINDSSARSPVSPITSPNVSSTEPIFPRVSSAGRISPLITSNLKSHEEDAEGEEQTTSDYVHQTVENEHDTTVSSAESHEYHHHGDHSLDPKLSVKRRAPPPLPSREILE